MKRYIFVNISQKSDTNAKLEEIKHNLRELNKSQTPVYEIEEYFQKECENFISRLSNYEYVGEYIDELIEDYGGNYIVLHNQSVVSIFPKDKGSEAQEESTKYEDGFAFFVPTISSEPGADSVQLSE